MTVTTAPPLRDVEIPLTDGSRMPGAVAFPDAGEPVPAVLVLHEALGLNDDIRGIAGRFAANGYAALAPDFLAGLGPRPFCIARFAQGLGRRRTGRPYRQLDAAREWLARRPEVDGGRIGVAGFCIGGGFALLWAADATPPIQVAAPFYAAVPDDAERELRGICPTVASYGGRDRVFARAAPRLAAALETIGVDHDVKVYPDAGHSFMNDHRGLAGAIARRLPTHAGLHPPSAEDAWARVLAFFERHLGVAEES